MTKAWSYIKLFIKKMFQFISQSPSWASNEQKHPPSAYEKVTVIYWIRDKSSLADSVVSMDATLSDWDSLRSWSGRCTSSRSSTLDFDLTGRNRWTCFLVDQHEVLRLNGFVVLFTHGRILDRSLRDWRRTLSSLWTDTSIREASGPRVLCDQSRRS